MSTEPRPLSHELPLTDPAYHQAALLLTLLRQAQQHLEGIALIADWHSQHPGCAEVLGQAVQLSLTLRKMERLLVQTMET